MTSSGQILDLRGIKWNLYFWKAHYKSYPKIQFVSILYKYFKSYGNIKAIWPLFGMGSSQIWPCHVTQTKNLSFPYVKSYCPLNFRKSHQISWFCCIPNGSYKEDNLKEGRIFPPPPPPSGIGLTGVVSVSTFSQLKSHFQYQLSLKLCFFCFISCFSYVNGLIAEI